MFRAHFRRSAGASTESSRRISSVILAIFSSSFGIAVTDGSAYRSSLIEQCRSTVKKDTMLFRQYVRELFQAS